MLMTIQFNSHAYRVRVDNHVLLSYSSTNIVMLAIETESVMAFYNDLDSLTAQINIRITGF